ncbi:MAG TPA: hypothetical protein VLA84_06100, partial [Microcoleus sp.]|nr:hypothetical protein [Microcoleus sp.]
RFPAVRFLKAEGRRQKAEGRRQKAEGRGRKEGGRREEDFFLPSFLLVQYFLRAVFDCMK